MAATDPQVLHLLPKTRTMLTDAPLKIFIIYAHEDRGFKEDLLKRLKLLRSQGLIAPWHDRDLVAGDDWDKVIRGHLAVADIVLPIISIDFFNSDYIEQVEIVEAFERYEQGHAHILPIIVRQCRWEDDPRISKLQALPENGIPIAKWLSADDAFDSVYDGIKAKIAEIRKAALAAEAFSSAEVLTKEEAKAAAEQAQKRALLLPAMVQVKGGTFRLGDKVECTLSDFAIGKYQVTFDEYDRYCEAMKIERPSDVGWGRGKRPVINVSWFDAVAYCNWLSEQSGLAPAYDIDGNQVNLLAGKGFRLLTESEWEYAARGGVAFKYYQYTGSNNLDEVGWYDKNSGRQTHPVGEKKANELGLHDMSGNVWEWCWDWCPTPKIGNPTRVTRGGCWGSKNDDCSVSKRQCNFPKLGNFFDGFRLAQDK